VVFNGIKQKQIHTAPIQMYDPRTSPLHESYGGKQYTSDRKVYPHKITKKQTIPGYSNKRVLLVCQAFPPLLKNAGGVAKRYLTLCRALIDGLGWMVTIVTPVNVLRSGNKDVERWLHDGTLVFLAARGVSVHSADGHAMFMDLFSAWNTMWLMHALIQHTPSYDICIMDDVPWRIHLLLLMRAFGVPTVVTSHTDVTHIKSYKLSAVMQSTWKVHMASATVADVHASVSRKFGEILVEREGVKVNGFWPPILWSNEFRADPKQFYVKESKLLRKSWSRMIEERDGFTPKVIFMFAGRWADEKRILQLFRCVPDGCGLVIVGDGTSEYSDQVATGTDVILEEIKKVGSRENEELDEDLADGLVAEASKVELHTPIRGVLPLRKMLNAKELRTAYQACDVFVSASAFETLGNTVVEALCCGTPVAVQPAQGHLEYVIDGVNSYFVDFDRPNEAQEKLAVIADGVMKRKLPVKAELECLGKKFRESNFALEFYEDVMKPAFDAREDRDWQHNKCCCFLETILVRPVSLLVWVLLWLIMRLISRCIYCCSKNPSFVILDQLGGSIESPIKGHFHSAHLKKE
jgi:glycosyltransferase involved in cell wall biosynthesis